MDVLSAFLGALVGSLLGFLGEKWLLRRSIKERYREKIFDKRIEAYESLYAIMLQSQEKSSNELKSEMRKWARKYDFYSTPNVISTAIDTLSYFDKSLSSKYYPDYDEITLKEMGERKKLELRAAIQSELGVELANLDKLKQLWH